MTSFVLVHGGGHGSWCWGRVVGPLRDAGHRVEAVDLPGRDGTLPDGYDEYVDVVAAAVDRATAPVVLVGHSFGGIAVSQFAERSPTAIAGLVLVNAVLLEDGEAGFAKLLAAGEQSVLLRPGVMRISEDGNWATVTAEDAVEAFYNRCDPADAEWAAARLCAEPIPPLMAPLRITDSGFGSVPKVYLGARADHALPWGFQEHMSSAAGAELIELGGDHSPFLSVPDEFLTYLLDGHGSGCDA